MLVEDREIGGIIVRIGQHYNENIATRFLRPLFAQILSDLDLGRHIVSLTEHSEDFVMQGFHLDDLYYGIVSLSRFIYMAKRDIIPNIHTLAEENIKTATDDRVYRNMAFNNLEPNLNLLTEMVIELYNATFEYDKKHTPKNRRCIADHIEGLTDIDKFLGQPVRKKNSV